jgi:hypothetical protein
VLDLKVRSFTRWFHFLIMYDADLLLVAGEHLRREQGDAEVTSFGIVYAL